MAAPHVETSPSAGIARRAPISVLPCVCLSFQAQVRINGTDMYIYDLRSDKRHYLSTIGKKGDTVYALVVTAPTGAYEKDINGLRHIQETFQLL